MKNKTMNIDEELIRVEFAFMLTNKISKFMNELIEDFNKENNGIELETIKMENVRYEISINGKKELL